MKETCKWALLLIAAVLVAVVSGNEDPTSIEQQSSQEVQVLPSTGLQLAHEVVNEQSDQPSSGEQFVAFHKGVSMGAREELSPTLLGVNGMAMKLLPPHLKLLSVISVHREIVAGVKYDLLVNAMQEDGERIVCQLVIFERPWIVNQWGEKWRKLQFSNCSLDDQPPPATPTETFQMNPVFQPPKEPQPMTEERMKELENQILQGNKRKVENSTPRPSPAPVSATSEDAQPPALGVGVQEELDKFFNTPQLATPPKQEEKQIPSEDLSRMQYSTSNQSPPVEEKETEKVVENVPQSEPETPKAPEDDNQENLQQVLVPVFENLPLENQQPQQQEVDNVPVSSSTRKRSLEAGFVGANQILAAEAPKPCSEKPFQFRKSGCPEALKHKRSVPGGLTDMSLDDEETKQIVNEAFSKLVGSPGGENLKLISTEKVQKQVVAGMAYRIDVVLKNGDDEPTKCHIRVWIQRWVSPEPREVTGECEDSTSYSHKRVTRGVDSQIVGGVTEVDNPENDLSIQSYLTDALAIYNDGQYGAGHVVHKILRATVQVVAGSLHKIDVELKNGDDAAKTCLVTVWDRPWLPNGRNIDVKCEGEDKVVAKTRSTRSLKYDWRTHLPENQNIRSSRDGAYEEELHQHLFQKFQTKFSRNYQSEAEKALRFRVFKTNLATIEQLNRHELGTAKYGLTEFSDLTPGEFKQYTGLLNAHENPRLHRNHIGNPMAEIPDIELPRSFDWRDQNVISEVKNQGQCGSCWAFSVVGNIEGLNAIKTGKLEEFSEQELVDCDTLDAGCNGGLPDNAYKAIEQIGGLEYENEYPYEASKKQCHFNKTMSHVRVKGAVDLPKDEKAMAQWLVQNGPISIGLNANAMQFYHGGVSHPYKILCRASKIDHGVLIVGFGQSDYPTLNKTLPYWIVKNSWGPSWGERGYYRVYRGDNTCGINSMASSAVLE